MPVSDYSDLDLPTDAKLAAGSYSEMAKIATTIRKNSMRKTIREISTDGSADWKDILPAFYGSGSILEAVEGIIVSMASAGKCGEAVRGDLDGNHVGTERQTWASLSALCSTLPGFRWVFVRPFENAPDVPSSANGVWDEGAVRVSLNAKNAAVGFVSFNPAASSAFFEWGKSNLSAEVKRGTVFMLMKTPTGMSFEELGEAGEKLERGNYSEEVLEDYDRLVKELKTDKPRGRLHILQGSPGGGKTYQIKGLLDECAESATMVLIPANLVPEVAGPNGVGIIVDFRRDYPNRPLVFLLEDADEVLAPRNGHNISGVSSLLNMGDGIVGATLDIRIVATTNATDAELDDAIKRPGRLNVLCTINKLNPERASAVYKRLTGTDMSFDTDMSLAEVYQKAYDAGWKGTGTKKGKKIGFA